MQTNANLEDIISAMYAACGEGLYDQDAAQTVEDELRRLSPMEAENAALKAANKDCVLHFDTLKADYDKLLAVNKVLVDALHTAIKQNSHDMLMTGEEIRKCESALKLAGEIGRAM